MIDAAPFSQQGVLVQLEVKVCLKNEQARLASILALLHGEVNGHLKVEIQIKPHIPHSTFCICDKLSLAFCVPLSQIEGKVVFGLSCLSIVVTQ